MMSMYMLDCTVQHVLHVLPYKGSRSLRCSPLLLGSAATALPLVPAPLLGERLLAGTEPPHPGYD